MIATCLHFAINISNVLYLLYYALAGKKKNASTIMVKVANIVAILFCEKYKYFDIMA